MQNSNTMKFLLENVTSLQNAFSDELRGLNSSPDQLTDQLAKLELSKMTGNLLSMAITIRAATVVASKDPSKDAFKRTANSLMSDLDPELREAMRAYINEISDGLLPSSNMTNLEEEVLASIVELSTLLSNLLLSRAGNHNFHRIVERMVAPVEPPVATEPKTTKSSSSPWAGK